jgi:hypothetical protein
VSGMAEPPDVTIVRESSPATPAAQPGVGTSGSQTPPSAQDSNAKQPPKISTEQQTRLEISSLRVRTVSPAGGTCTP